MTTAKRKKTDMFEVLTNFEGVTSRGGENKWQCKCPAHEDKQASLSIEYDPLNNKVLYRCHAGCTITRTGKRGKRYDNG